MNDPLVVAGEYAACATDAVGRSRAAKEAVARRRRLMGTSWRRDEAAEGRVYEAERFRFTSYVSRLRWCRRPDSNRHGLPHTPLKRTCLPIPPRRQLTVSRDLPRDWRAPAPERLTAVLPARRARAARKFPSQAAPEPERR